jgi:hypothetical protein
MLLKIKTPSNNNLPSLLLLLPQLPMETSTTPTMHHSAPLPAPFLNFGPNGPSQLVAGSLQKTSQQLSVDKEKFKYSCSKVVWELIVSLVQSEYMLCMVQGIPSQTSSTS